MGQNQSRSEQESEKTQEELLTGVELRIKERYPDGIEIPSLEVAIIKKDDDLIQYHLYVRKSEISALCLIMAIKQRPTFSDDRVKNILLQTFDLAINDLVLRLIDCGAKINEYFVTITPLHFCLIEKKEILSDLLISKGADVNLRTKCTGDSPLHIAAKNNDSGMIISLLEHNADANAINNNAQTPLHFASQNRNPYIIEKLLIAGANVNALDNKGKPPLLKYVNPSKQHITIDVKLTKLFIQTIMATPPDKSSRTLDEIYFRLLKRFPLIKQMWDEEVRDLILTLIKNNWDLNTQSCFGTLLHYAAKTNNIAFAKTLILGGADVNLKRDNDLQTPLHLAVKHVDVMDVAEMLIENGADIFAVDADGKTPLTIAEENGNLKLVEYLKSKDAKGKEKEDAPIAPTLIFSNLTLKSDGGESSTPSNRARSNSWPVAAETLNSRAMRPGSPF